MTSFYDGLGVGWLSAIVMFFWWEGRRARLGRRIAAQDATIIHMRAKERL